MSEKDDGGPAFPSRPPMGRVTRSPDGPIIDLVRSDFDGMSLRDWFAGQALAGLAVGDEVPGRDVLARYAYEFADAMLRARNLLPPPPETDIEK